MIIVNVSCLHIVLINLANLFITKHEVFLNIIAKIMRFSDCIVFILSTLRYFTDDWIVVSRNSLNFTDTTTDFMGTKAGLEEVNYSNEEMR